MTRQGGGEEVWRVWGASACSDREAAHWYRGSAAPTSERWGRVVAAAMRGDVAAAWSNRA